MKYIYYIALKDNYELTQGRIEISEETDYSYKIKPINAIKELKYKTVFNKRDDGGAEWTTNPKNIINILKNIYLSQTNKLYTQINILQQQYKNIMRTYGVLARQPLPTIT